MKEKDQWIDLLYNIHNGISHGNSSYSKYHKRSTEEKRGDDQRSRRDKLLTDIASNIIEISNDSRESIRIDHKIE